ncbi:hypothetical protein CK203_038851 [Vitis vinifera]|uniref:Uncharacterized protein n=1 Tax=Vitis vinifera TaxID=29760 RepID=A0A438I1V7_VITVI|nr:hypothetical protein CK203_038851 [Vitis vinifera]
MFQYSKHFSNHLEIKVGLKEVIKRLESDLDRQAKTINEVKLFVDDQGEFGSALTKKQYINLFQVVKELEHMVIDSYKVAQPFGNEKSCISLPTNEEGRERDVYSCRKSKASRTISLSSSSDDGDNRGCRRDGGTSGDNRGVGGTSGDNRGVGGTSEGTGGDGSIGGVMLVK